MFSGGAFSNSAALVANPSTALRCRGAEVPVDLEFLARLLCLPPGVGDDGDARFHAWLPWRIGCGGDAAIDNQNMAYAGQRFDLIEVSALHLAGKYGGLFDACVQHSGQLDIDAEERLAGHNLRSVNALLRVADDAVVLGIFELHARQVGRGQRGSFGGKLPIARGAPRGSVHHAAGLSGAFSRGHGPGLRSGRDQQLASGCADAAHRLPAHRRVRGASGKLPAVYLFVQVGLLDSDVLPIDIQFLGNQHRQHVPHALA